MLLTIERSLIFGLHAHILFDHCFTCFGLITHDWYQLCYKILPYQVSSPPSDNYTPSADADIVN